MTLEQLLGDLDDEAIILRRNGVTAQADTLARVAGAVRLCMAAYLDRMTEEEARSRSGRSVAWLRAQHADWLEEGLAGWDGKRRWYRRCVIPRRLNLEAIQGAAARAAKARAA